ncbi:GNAT family N-acetyltransferase [Paracerasibacillus soli]|uniref:GNAT family N-acetyltransferase n=1 Tax=Paracerasibacillus soli TaxID=480284 RepID=A0ABU5CVM4_9BACI|nr:GNAT family N-acetyltransferase [Virgibacillus soli]MDY0410422.1 GNAT family N-acetyltransferase [Virgibacillus soli]
MRLQAQLYLEKFYSSLGFTRISKEYVEDGIPHVDMIWEQL